MIKNLLKILLLVAALGYLVFALVKVSRPVDEMVCTGFEFDITDSTENCLINKKVVEDLMAQNKITPKGKKLSDINLNEIEQILAKNPYIDTANCYHTASGKVCARIVPMHPILHVFSQDGDEFYVDRQGNILPAGGISTKLCIVTGNASRKYASTKLLSLGKFIEEDAYWNLQTQQINIDNKGNVEITPRIGDLTIVLGEPKNIAEKLQRVRLFYEKGLPKAGWNKYTRIDATYQNQIICTK